jgi:hypothetical protein
MLFANLASDLLKLMDGEIVQLVGVGQFTQMHTELIPLEF